jgi:hypothetical protein
MIMSMRDLEDIYRNRDGYYDPGFVYIAGSLAGRVMKIGKTKNPRRRQQKLQNRRYGGLSDWAFLFYARASECARIESDALWRLRRHLTLESWESETWGNAQEIVRCSFSEALDVLYDLIDDDWKSGAWWSPRWDRYCV